ncbi:hypothetical protein E3N88_43167 [Mikania micrantha]|uniref:Sec-independent protein translocase protein TATB, chloroplastic n=1 Tax=Mikania micrantha TaxID=192012 RepID=A0A5N6LFQ1_9ASTR|nr:hypothetical protein E3N88_43167 [Mikania micrantha]
MASAIFNPPYLSNPSSSSLIPPKILGKSPFYASLSTSHISRSRTLIIRSSTWAPYLGITPISAWNGLRKTGFSISLQSLKLKLEKKRKCKGNGVFASLFGVGAPEALVIGVVALLVFGPKGLAEVAKTMGKTLRSFQPTIRELQEVSREFKSTLEKEIGLDELQNPQGTYTSNTVRPPPDTLENSQLTATPPDTLENSQLTATPPDTLENSQSTATPPEDSQAATTTPADVTMEDSQPTIDTANGSSSTTAYTSEDLLKITEEQLKAVASQQQTASPENPKGEI